MAPDGQTIWALLLEYDGGPFVGWQRQDAGLSVQEVLEAAAARLARGAKVAATVAGRTDSGVHAAGQVVSLPLPEGFSARQVRDALNYHMKPHPVVVIRAAPAREGWNPRFSAVHRSYRYLILNRRARPALLLGRAWHVAAPLDAEAMHAAAQTLLGTHDFTSFRAAACQAKSPIRTLDRLDVTRDGDVITLVAELPAPPGPQSGRHIAPGRRSQMANRAARRCPGGQGPKCGRSDRARRGAVSDAGALSGGPVRGRRCRSSGVMAQPGRARREAL